MKSNSIILILCSFIFGFQKNNALEKDNIVPKVFSKIYGASSIANDGEYITIKTNGVPDHKSPYFANSDSLYEIFNGSTFEGNTFRRNPNRIISQSYTFRIPLNPKEDFRHTATRLGPIGVALNGVPLFNQYAGPNNQELTFEIASFDKYNGHPQRMGMYHYHVEPIYLTSVKSAKSGLLGFLLDGFPVYGPLEENNKKVINDDLDVFHGHSHTTIDYPKGIYHYHFTAEAPYLNGNGYYGTSGTISH